MELSRAEILAKKLLSSQFLHLTLMAPTIARLVRPGQFMQVKTSDGLDPLLRRPISVHGWDSHQGTIELLIQVRGKGTTQLARRCVGDKLDLFGPLGNGFDLSNLSQGGHALLVGGGIGAAPLWGLAETLLQQNRTVTVMLGAANGDLLAGAHQFQRIAKTLVSTDDGSVGVKGKVTSLLPLVAGENFQQIFACGPKPMLAALAGWAEANQLPLQVSLDEVMACGMGVCLGCVHPVRRQQNVELARVCSQGPVFNAREVVWND